MKHSDAARAMGGARVMGGITLVGMIAALGTLAVILAIAVAYYQNHAAQASASEVLAEVPGAMNGADTSPLARPCRPPLSP